MASDGTAYGTDPFIDGSDCTVPGGGWPDMDAPPNAFPHSNSASGWGTSASATFRTTHTAKTPAGGGFSGDLHPTSEDVVQ
jgi:hypothetical protein